MRRFVHHRILAALALAAISIGCGSDNDTPTTPTPTPTAPATTELFSGIISAANGHTYPFVSLPGTVTLTLTTVTPDTTPLGISIGTWSGSACTVGTGLFNDAATQGTVITANVSQIGALCARVYDGAGLIAAPTTYLITVVHP
jgi:hypothetical protein